MRYCHYTSDIGALLLASDDAGLRHIVFPDTSRPIEIQPGWQRDYAAHSDACAQLDAYFRGTLTQFDLPLSPAGTAFQQSVWAALQEIDYGTTQSYSDIATRIGRPTATRAVGSANGANPLPIVIPCHRVIGSSGNLTGFSGGLATKSWLLAHERGEPCLFH